MLNPDMTGLHPESPIDRPPFVQNYDRKKSWYNFLLESRPNDVYSGTSFDPTLEAEPKPDVSIPEIEQKQESNFPISSALPQLSDFSNPKAFTSDQGRLDQQAELVLRSHYLNLILHDIEKLQQYAGTATAAVYINSVFDLILQFCEKSPYDPFMDIMTAFYDALAYDDKWTFFEIGQYQMAQKILRSFGQEAKLNYKKAAKGIMQLEKAGFDTTPFSIEFDSNLL